MIEIPYSTLVWLAYRMAATFAIGMPLVLLIWAQFKRASSLIRLLNIYWKIASLFAISILLLTDQRPIGFLTLFLAPILMVGSIWFWIDLNEELADLPPWRPLPLTIRVWRWALSCFGLLSLSISLKSLSCITIISGENCITWLAMPKQLHQVIEKIFSFLFGGNWSEPIAAFVGYMALVIYILGLLQWLLIKLPRQGRIAGDF